MSKKSKMVTPDYSIELTDNMTLELYDRTTKKEKKVTAKVTCDDVFCCYGKVIFYTDKKKKENCFLSLPSWIDKNGERHGQAFFFDSDIINTIQKFLEDNLLDD